MTALPYGGAPTRIGELDVLPVFDGYSREDPTHFYTLHEGAPPRRGERREDWAEYPGFLDADGFLEHGLGGFLSAPAAIPCSSTAASARIRSDRTGPMTG